VGIPAVATKTRCVSRFFDGSEVELVEVGDVDSMAHAIVRLAKDAKLRKARADKAKKWEEEFGWEGKKRHLFRAIDQLCIDKLLAEKGAAKAAKAEAAVAR